MMPRVVVLLAALLLCAGCVPRKVPDARFVLQGEAASPKATFFLRQYIDRDPGSKGERQLWVREKTGESYFLFRYFRIAQVVISPDEDCLVINDRRSGNEAGIVLCRRETGGRFAPVSRPDLDALAWKRFQRDLQGDGRTVPEFSHHYVWCPRWIDGTSFVVSLQGYGDEGLVEHWAYFYDMKTGGLIPDPQNNLKYVELPVQ